MTDNCPGRDQSGVGRFAWVNNSNRLRTLQDDRFRNTVKLRKQCVRASARTALGAGRCAEPIIPASTDRTRSRHKPTGTRRFAPSGMHHRLASGLSGHRVCPPTSRASSREKAPMKTPDARANASRPGTGLRPSVLRSRFPAPTLALEWSPRFGGTIRPRRTGRENRKRRRESEKEKEKGEGGKAVGHPVGSKTYEPSPSEGVTLSAEAIGCNRSVLMLYAISSHV